MEYTNRIQSQPLHLNNVDNAIPNPNPIENTAPNANLPPLLPVRKRKETSVWKEFMKFFKEGVAHARCNHWNAELEAKSANGTTSLSNHSA